MRAETNRATGAHGSRRPELTRCIVKSYLHWLQDSDFESVCALCQKALAAQPTVRLTCLGKRGPFPARRSMTCRFAIDLFHIECLEKNCQALPKYTARAGYTCPTCKVRASLCSMHASAETRLL